ncbi:ABC-three component system middle component 6 [Lacticaseibacillus paracasei]|uniref:ABC-three component system middle component 6 n=1 Tax=Lacticaseibacillus paracasei TaxID=1597 RepID=UPI00345D11B8
MLIVDRDSKPANTVLYVSAILSHLIKSSPLDVATLYSKFRQLNTSQAPYTTFLNALSFLYILDRIILGEDGKIYEAE